MQEKFEELFTKFDKDNKGGLTLWEMIEMGKSSRKIMDPFGWSASAFEWGSTYYVAHNKVRPNTSCSMLTIFWLEQDSASIARLCGHCYLQANVHSSWSFLAQS